MSPSLTPATRERLRIAIQKSGRLAEPARTLLAACGLSWRESRDKLFCYGESLPVDLLLVRDDDIPGLIADGVCDLGVVGRNVLLEQAGERSRFRAAGHIRHSENHPAPESMLKAEGYSSWQQPGQGAVRRDRQAPARRPVAFCGWKNKTCAYGTCF